jgi:hypothetical protein
MTLPRRSVRLKAIGFVLLAEASAVLWMLTLHELSQGDERAWGHMAQAVLETCIALAALRWTFFVGRLQAAIGTVVVVFYPIQAAVRGLPMDAVAVVETIVVLPAERLGSGARRGLKLRASAARRRSRPLRGLRQSTCRAPRRRAGTPWRGRARPRRRRI